MTYPHHVTAKNLPIRAIRDTAVSRTSTAMKYQIVFFLFATVLLSVKAVPLLSTWYKLAPAAQLKGVSDFWSNCGK